VKLAGEIRFSGAAVTLVVHEHKRLGRGIELAMLAEELKASDVGLEFLTGELQGSHDPSGIVFTVPATMSGMEREYIRDRTLEGHESARKRGKTIGGAGVTDPDMLSTALHLRDQEMSLRDIAKRLVITTGTKKGQHPSSATVRRMPVSPLGETERASPAARGADRVGSVHVQALHTAAHAFSLADDAFGGTAARQALSTCLSATAAWLTAPARPSTHHKLLEAAAVLAYLCGWTHCEKGAARRRSALLPSQRPTVPGSRLHHGAGHRLARAPQPVWGGYHQGALDHQRATVLWHLNEHDAAIDALRDSLLHHRPSHELSTRAYLLDRLARLQLAQGHLEAACAGWHEALTHLPLESRHRKHAHAVLRARLHPYRTHPTVKDLLDRTAEW